MAALSAFTVTALLTWELFPGFISNHVSATGARSCGILSKLQKERLPVWLKPHYNEHYLVVWAGNVMSVAGQRYCIGLQSWSNAQTLEL